MKFESETGNGFWSGFRKMEQKVKIITDSACDMPRDQLNDYGIQLIPLNITQGEVTLRDGIDIHPAEMYERMRAGERFKTAQISYQTFYDIFLPYAKSGEPFIYFAFSGGLSGTYQTSCLALSHLAEEYPDMIGACIDTKAVAGGLGLYMEDIGEAAKEGMGFDDLIKLAEDLTHRIKHVFSVEDLNYLYEGGRLSKTSAVVGNLLAIKPILEINPEGKIDVIAKIRGENKIIKTMLDYIRKNGGAEKENARFLVTNADNPDLMNKVIAAIEKEFKPSRIDTMPMAAVIGTHTGPGTITLHFYDQRDEIEGMPEQAKVVFHKGERS